MMLRENAMDLMLKTDASDVDFVPETEVKEYILNDRCWPKIPSHFHVTGVRCGHRLCVKTTLLILVLL
jgi:hypothetical protein